ncbi:THUMP domain-containing class I SAM-dependent RNA methyltransferase [Hyphomicrobium sulfonivorans]|uniref:THUMP domain-containing class I SAM-dependent RNA methyltransferase n=2 Tax=Hyphomicrobium sulfonivorans TaxID=121290 RepID=UPI001FEA51AA|nr:class I SAM-dependent RNA methyltransferase [Hyphomicrobium sulfonivorans]
MWASRPWHFYGRFHPHGMKQDQQFEIFLVATPGLEGPLCAEARACGFKAKTVPGGVEMKGGWPDVWRANLELRGAGKVYARIDSFHVKNLGQLERRAKTVPWRQVLRKAMPFRVEATCKSSKVYHSGAAEERIAQAITEQVDVVPDENADVCIKVRIENNICTVAVDTSGELLHKRGHKQAVAKAPMRETMASLFLRQCGFDGTQTVLDPMCGSGTFVIEAAETASALMPGRARRFAFEKLKGFDDVAWRAMREAHVASKPAVRFYGSDIDAGAIRMSRENAERAGVADITSFQEMDVADITPPEGAAPGIVIINPPYGDRIGNRANLKLLYRTMGDALLKRFSGWRVGLVTNEEQLAQATGLPFSLTAEPVLHGGMRIVLYRTGPLP